MKPRWVVILAALDSEYAAVRSRLTGVRVQSHAAGTRFEIGTFHDHRCQAAIALVGKGNHSAAVLTERAIAQFNPVAVLFVGVAGARMPHVALGDIVVATHIYAYHGGTSQDDGLKSRPRVWEVSHRADQIARHVARNTDWWRQEEGRPGPPKIHFGPIAAGEIVHDSAISSEARWIREHYNDALAIEMEAAGVAQAGHLNDSLAVMVIRGISDRADGSKNSTDRAHWQERAVEHAAAFAAAVAGELARQPQTGNASTSEQTDRGREMGGPVTNIARDCSRVGVQAGQVYGGVEIRQGPREPADPLALTADLRQQLQEAYRAGRIDESIREAAEAELDVVTQVLSTSSAQERSKLTVALKRLHGLISDVADLAAKVVTIISAVRGMP